MEVISCLSDQGALPEGWRSERLGRHVEIRSGESPSLFSFQTSGIPYFKVEQLNGSNKYLTETPYLVKIENPVVAGSIIFPKRGASILLNKIRLLPEAGYMDTNLMSLTPRGAIHGEFLFYWLSHKGLAQFADITSIPQINNKHILPLEVSFPEDSVEQCRIASALSDADALIDSLEQLLTKKRQIKQGAMQELLTGKRRLPGFALEWSASLLRDISDMKSGESITAEKLSDSNTYPCFGGNGLRGYAATFTHDGQFALIGRQGALCGNVTLVQGRFFASEHAVVVTPCAGVDSCWLHYVLVRMNLNQYSESSAQPGLAVERLLQLEIRVPELAEQTAIAQVLSDMDADIATVEARLTKARALKQAMAQVLLTGRVRLVEGAAA